MQMRADLIVFQIKNGKAHRLTDDPDKKRFPLGRAKCAPIDRRPADTIHEPNEISSKDFCRFCL